jgi:CheY-like chemotaxis protein
MRILFLDDSERRQTAMKRNCVGFVLDQAWDADQAIAFLKGEHHYDLICLDHDLADEHYATNKDDDKDGRYVCRELVKMQQRHGATVIVHTLNVVMQPVMRDLLKDNFKVHVVPYVWDYVWKDETGNLRIGGKKQNSADSKEESDQVGTNEGGIVA